MEPIVTPRRLSLTWIAWCRLEMRLWYKDRSTEPDLVLSDQQISDKFLLECVEDIYLEHPDTTIKELLRWFLNMQGWVFDENEFEDLYQLVLVEGEWGNGYS
jgi:hypothetical protein